MSGKREPPKHRAIRHPNHANHFLDDSGGLSDDLVLAAAHEGEIAFIGEVLARRAGIGVDSALDELLSGDSKRLMAMGLSPWCREMLSVP